MSFTVVGSTTSGVGGDGCSDVEEDLGLGVELFWRYLKALKSMHLYMDRIAKNIYSGAT